MKYNIFKVIFGDRYYEQINNFLEGYKNSFKKLYTDTGIENEYLLHQGYIENARKIKNEVKIETEKTLEQEIIGYRLYLTGEKSVKIFLKSFMLEVYFEEDDKEKIRFVEKIIINKK